MLPRDPEPPHRRCVSLPRHCGQLEEDGGCEEGGSEVEKAAPPGVGKRRRRRRRRGKSPAAPAGTPPSAGGECGDEVSEKEEWHVRRMAIYFAMAQAGLVLSLALLYGLARLLEGYWRPVGWALLCSIPLRRLHTALVSFWSLPLRLGLLETLLALPLAALRTATASLLESHSALLRLLQLLRRRSSGGLEASCYLSGGAGKVGFSKLMQWLVSFGLFTLAHERLGLLSLPAFAAACLLARATGGPAPAPIASTLSAISSARYGRGPPPASLLARAGGRLTSALLRRLHTLVGVGLIVIMVAGSISGFIFFSYKMGMEGKDAVISIKTHLQEHNYSERIGLQQLMDKYDIPGTIELCTSRLYETASQYVDSIALQYNATGIVEGFRKYLIRPPESSIASLGAPEQTRPRPILESLRHLQLRVWNAEWKVELERMFREFLGVLAREDLVGKLRGLALESVSVSKRVFENSTMVLAGGANLFLSVVVSIVSGATEVLNFVSELMVFFWLLYYLITSDSGGVMDHAMGMLPISMSTRARCVEVLDHAVSSVLLAAAKVALFQGCFTYLLFRFYNIHFLYVSTFLAWMSSVFPVTPNWLSSIPAAAQLAIEARYIEAVALTAIHLILLEYGTAVIQHEIPGQSSYLTGLSILGGMALFPSVLEGAVAGPVLMTIVIAVKNLYAEFVLSSAKVIGIGSTEQHTDFL